MIVLTSCLMNSSGISTRRPMEQEQNASQEWSRSSHLQKLGEVWLCRYQRKGYWKPKVWFWSLNWQANTNSVKAGTWLIMIFDAVQIVEAQAQSEGLPFQKKCMFRELYGY
jgi:hypothetical protein